MTWLKIKKFGLQFTDVIWHSQELCFYIPVKIIPIKNLVAQNQIDYLFSNASYKFIHWKLSQWMIHGEWTHYGCNRLNRVII